MMIKIHKSLFWLIQIKKKHRFNFTVGGEELKFSLRYPFKTGETFSVTSEDLEESFAKDSNSKIKKLKDASIGDVMDIITTQYAAVSQDDGDGGFDDDVEEDYNDDGFNFEDEPPKKMAKKKCRT